MRAFFSDDQLLHKPQQFMRVGRLMLSNDLPDRAYALRDVFVRRGISVEAPQDYGRAPLEMLHSVEYLDYLETAYDLWREVKSTGVEPGIEVLPNVAPYYSVAPGSERPPCPSSAPLARAGYYISDLSCPIGSHTWRGAMRSAHSAIAAADAVLADGGAAYALSRPSGHHARRDCAAGTCFINNSALAAQRLCTKYRRVAVLDVDAHHGDGTQAMFYTRADILTISVHGDPDKGYPFYTGFSHERGVGDGEGYNLNLPLANGAGNAEFLEAIDTGVAAVREFAPDAIVVPLGLDAYRGDPLSALNVDLDTFRDVGARIGALGLPTVLVQEGGYAIEALGTGLDNFVDGFLSTR